VKNSMGTQQGACTCEWPGGRPPRTGRRFLFDLRPHHLAARPSPGNGPSLAPGDVVPIKSTQNTGWSKQAACCPTQRKVLEPRETQPPPYPAAYHVQVAVIHRHAQLEEVCVHAVGVLWKGGGGHPLAHGPDARLVRHKAVKDVDPELLGKHAAEGLCLGGNVVLVQVWLVDDQAHEVGDDDLHPQQFYRNNVPATILGAMLATVW
jgi:hypothetical protein